MMRHEPPGSSVPERALRDDAPQPAAVVKTPRIASTEDARPVVRKEFVGPGAQRSCMHEAAMLERLAHVEGVPRLAGVQNNHHASDHVLSLYNCSGDALSHLLERRAFEPAAVLAFACKVARILADVHAAGVVHRNINPACVIARSEGDFVLIDFQHATLADRHSAEAPHDGVAGALHYLAPEQTGRTGSVVDARADLYSIGTLLYRMAAGRLPFQTSDTLQFIHDLLVLDPLSPSDIDGRVPQGLSQIILRLLAKSPAARYQSAEGVLHDLRRLQRELNAGADGTFALGDRDFPSALAAPARVIGRAIQRSMLRGAFDESLSGGRHTVLVEGPAGVGKTALIDELRGVVATAGGWFIQGKFDQYQKDSATASALSQALRGLGRILLALPREELAVQRRRILDRLGFTAGVITRMLPEFSLLLGPQADAPEVDLRQAEIQLQEATVNLLLAVVSRERPIVVALDDLQWAAALHLRTFERLMAEPKSEGLLLVGACRTGEEAAEGTALRTMLDRWRAQGVPMVHLPVANLEVAELGDLIGEMLRLPPEHVQELARSLHAITNGNPLDTVELLNALRREGVLRVTESGWHWSDLEIRQFVGRDNVVDLLTVRIARLHVDSRELLECMSCLGNSVELQLLAAAMDLSEQAVKDRLAAPVGDGLLVGGTGAGPPSVRFRHDRVQQAVMKAMGDRSSAHWRPTIARRLAQSPQFEDQAAEQFLACAESLQTPGEKLQAARLLVMLGGKLARTADYALADRYLATAHALTSHLQVVPDDLRVAIDTARHFVLYPLGRLDEADGLFAHLQASSADPLSLVDATCRQMRSLDVRGRMDDAKVLGLMMLGRLGLHAPDGFVAGDTDQRLDALADWVRDDERLDPATRPQMQDPEMLGIAKLLGRTVRSALVRYDKSAIVWLLLESHRLWVSHGPCPELVANLGRMSSMLIALRRNHRAAYEFSRHILRVGEALGYEPQTSEARFVFATYAAHWFDPLETVFSDAKRSYEVIRARGDPSYACFVHMNMLLTQLEMSPTIDACVLEVESGLALCNRTGNKLAQMHHVCEGQLLRAMRGQTRAPASFDDAQFDEEALLPLIRSLPNLEQTHRSCRAVNGLLMGDASVLIPNALRAVEVAPSITGYYLTTYSFLTGAIARAWELRQALAMTGRGTSATEDGTSAIEEGFLQCRTWIAGRAADQPYNLLHLLWLVDAEMAWARGELVEARLAFDEALVEAHARQRPWHCALICERAGLFHLETALQYTGRMLLAEARRRYEKWGASAKVAQLEKDHPFLQRRGAATDPGSNPDSRQLQDTGDHEPAVSADSLDLLGLLRASQALSSERSLSELIARVVQVLGALSGASRVLVLSWHANEWWLHRSDSGKPVPATDAAAMGLLPMSAVAYVERTSETVLADDACSDDRFARDPYFNGVLLCSLLAIPIASQGGARAMLILENRQGRAAFGAKGLDAVMLIAGQLAVSLSNVQLYEQLEERVQARTREIEVMQAQLVDAARRAGKAEIANNVLHNVGNVLNSITVSAGLVRKALAQSRWVNLSEAVRLLSAHRHDLTAFVEKDPAGQHLIPYLERLTAALEDERRSVGDDLERLVQSVDHIANVLAIQQSNSGPSSLVEPVRPDDIVKEALGVCAQVLHDLSIEVDTTQSGAPAIPVDKHRIVQILVNLIRNAAQAMGAIPVRARKLHVTCSVVAPARGEADLKSTLAFSVRDTGEGIARANLERIFAHGFSTRPQGHGFGLHSSAVAAMEMGGKLVVQSEGPGLGATFQLEVPAAETADTANWADSALSGPIAYAVGSR